MERKHLSGAFLPWYLVLSLMNPLVVVLGFFFFFFKPFSRSSPVRHPLLIPLFMKFSRQEYWSGLPFPSPGDLPNPGIEPGSLALQADSFLSELPGKSYFQLVLITWASFWVSDSVHSLLVDMVRKIIILEKNHFAFTSY